MKKILVILSVAFFALSAPLFGAEQAKPELRPSQKLMQARAAWMAAINKNLGENSFAAVIKDAGELADEAEKTGEKISNPLGKEITLATSSLARELSAAAGKGDAEAAKAKLGEIRARCGQCHNQIRDKK